ncbi:MAG: L-erythro-3,5-diaminohexanoate dehydrogenase, partial [Mycobacteriales bacterium]
MVRTAPSSPLGLHRVVSPAGVLPQAADVLDATPEIYRDEVRVAVERLNLDAASFRQLRESHGDGDGVRAAVLETVRRRGKMHNSVTGSGGMLIGTVDEVGPDSPLGLAVGERVATLVSLTLTPLRITDELARWDGRSEQVPAEGSAILFARSIAAGLPDDLPGPLALAALDVCGAPALTTRVVSGYVEGRTAGRCDVAVLGAAGKSGSLALAAARAAGAVRCVGVVPNDREATLLSAVGLADEVVVADARDAIGLAAAIGEPVDVT